MITIFAQYVPKKYGMVKFSNRTPILEDRILIEICASNDETSLVTVNYIYGVINDEVQKAAKLRYVCIIIIIMYMLYRVSQLPCPWTWLSSTPG